MKIKLKLSQRVLLLVCALLAFELAFLGGLLFLLDRSESQAEQEARSKEALYQSAVLMQKYYQIVETTVRYGLTTDPRYKEQFNQAASEIPVILARLKEHCGNSRKQLKALESVISCSRSFGEIAQEILKAAEVEGMWQMMRIQRLNQRSIKLVDKMVEGLTLYQSLEREKLEEQPCSAKESRQHMKHWMLALVAFNIATAIWLALAITRGITSRLEVLSDNTIRLAEGSALNRPVGGDDEISQLDQSFHNMARALAEAVRKERAMIEKMPVGLITIDEDGRIDAVNPRAREMFACQQNELTGQSLERLFASLPSDGSRSATEAILEKAQGRACELKGLRWDGNSFPIEVSINNLGEESSKRYLLSVIDVSERHEVERMKREFVAMVGHDLRSPLTSVQGLLGLLATSPDVVREDREAATVAEGELSRLINLINDLLDVARMESGKFAIACRDTTASAIVNRSLTSVQALAGRKRIRIETATRDLGLAADEDRLVQVMVNLLSNAIKFSPDETTIKIMANQERDSIKFQVIDQGRGVPEHLRDAIFDRFQQVEAADGRRRDSTGLGLAICKAIVEEHGGAIGVESGEGEGSTFWFSLPRDGDARQ